ncbi:hypothetical protein M378DRAFT_85641, partial [Amanita muscaria Koide BX008]
MYVLSGLAGIGKSTVAYTIASRAAHLNLLGASFFFSRDEADRNNAKKFFTTIAYQLCVYNGTFAEAIGDALKTERGSAAATKDPQDQLRALILNPLRSIVQSRARPILVIVDALDECDEDDERDVVRGLSQLVRELPSFKVILTTLTRYQSVVGAIISVQRPLPVSTLAQLINIDVVEIREVLDNLQSVILLGSDNAPRIYHKSFPDYLTDEARCKDPRLQIDTRICHIRIATRCFEIMDKRLKRNILGLGDPARFMRNEDGLKKDEITDKQIQEKIPQQLRYACVYWDNHLEVAKIEDEALMNELEKFVDEHMLHWLEVLSLIRNFDLAHVAIRVVLKLLKPGSSDLRQLLSDALRFIGKFYELIKRSALHTYYSALPFTPSDSLLYRRYIKDAVDNVCSIEGGPENWDALVANITHGTHWESVDIIKFSLASTLFVSCSYKRLKIWDAVTGTPIFTIAGDS